MSFAKNAERVEIWKYRSVTDQPSQVSEAHGQKSAQTNI